MTSETAPISGGALRFHRREQNLSQRELGRRVAKRLGRAEATRAFQVRLSRIETGDEISEEDRELVDALAAELALGEEDLATPPRWIWIKQTTQGSSPVFTFVALGLRMPAFSSPEEAYRARDALAHASGGMARPFQDATLFPIHGAALTTTVLDVNFGTLSDEEREFLLPLDPNLDDLRFFFALQLALEGGVMRFEGEAAQVYGEREDLAESAARLALEERQFENELVELHSLALRRLQQAPPEGEHLIDSWKREEEALFEILERIYELRRERRDEALGL